MKTVYCFIKCSSAGIQFKYVTVTARTEKASRVALMSLSCELFLWLVEPHLMFRCLEIKYKSAIFIGTVMTG